MELLKELYRGSTSLEGRRVQKTLKDSFNRIKKGRASREDAWALR
jgi:hypothetical protein